MTLKHFLNKLLSLVPGTRQSRVKRAAKKSIENFQKTLELLDKYDKGESSKDKDSNQTVAGPKRM